MSQATGSTSSGNLLAIDVNGSKVHDIVGDETGDAWLTILLPMETRLVVCDNNIILRPNLHHQTSVVPYSTDNHSNLP